MDIERNDVEIQNALKASSIENVKHLEKEFSWTRMKKIQNWKADAEFVREGKEKGYLKEESVNKESIDIFTRKSMDFLIFFNYLN